jgi:hypothetical protein
MTNKSSYQHSFEVQEIIGKTPGWMVRWGITALLATLLILLISSAVINYPVVTTPEIKLVLSSPLFYIQRNAGETLEFKKNSGQVTQHDLIAVASDTSGRSRFISAPYAGLIKPLSIFSGNGSVTDTLAVVIPKQVSYRFKGTLPAMYARQNIKGKKVNVIIAKNYLPGEQVVLQGVIDDISPVAISGSCSFWGNLDAASNKKLAQAAVLADTCEGFIEITVSQRSILKRILSGAII